MSSGFSYPKPIFSSPIYNPAFYLTLDASGYLTYDYAQTLYLGKNDYRLTYITGITPGTATQGVALIPGTNNDISGIGALSCTSLTVNGSSVSSAPTYVLSITPGTAAINKALVLGASGEIGTITSLTATSITGTLQTAVQTNITSIGVLTNLTLNTANTGLQTPNIKFWNGTTLVYDNFDHSQYIGTIQGGCVAQKALVVDLNKDIGSIRNLSCTGAFTASTSISTPTLIGTTLNINPTTLQLRGTTITATAAELNYLDITTLGSAQASKALTCNASSDIISINSLTAATLNSSSLLSASITAGSTYTAPVYSSMYNIICRNDSITNSTFAGLAFHIDSGSIGATTPGAAIISQRTSATAYDGSSIEFWTKGTAAQAGALSRRMTITNTGSINFGSGNSTDGDLLLLKPTSNALFRFGSATSANNCYSIQWTYVAAGSSSNRLGFDAYGSSNTLCMTADKRVCVGGNAPESQLHVLGSSGNLYGSWERVQEWWNDQGAPIKVGLIIYNEAGNSDTNGASFGTYTADPLRFMIGGSNKMLLNTSGRLAVNRVSPEATIHAGGMIWADELFHSKQNVDGKCVYRTNWSQANYLGWGTDATVGAMRLGVCDANFNWVSYSPCRGGSYTNASDRRLKKDIVEIPYGLDEVLRMQPKRFAMRNDNSNHVGFIAQEMAEIIPECVSGVESPDDELNESGEPINPMGIDLASLVSVLTKAIQEIKKEVDELRSIIAE
ncbi:hypothetical protein ON010_g10128 [Phytophthora cinnamomi]|nr:hypothetical protein ON010_g10128 [Phytophthora cinnamomi]